jgi:hypothetical protein
VVLVNQTASVMYRKLGSINCFESTHWKKLLNCQFTKLPTLRQQNILRFTTNCSINWQSQRPDKPLQQDKSLIQNAIATFKGNPYVRLMRLDRPIGKFRQNHVNPQQITMTIRCRLVAALLALQLVHRACCITGLPSRPLHNGPFRGGCCDHEGCWMYHKRHVG